MLSVFIPSYNHAGYVIETIASTRAIDVPGLHIYVIDDASTDGSVDVIERYLAETGASDVTLIAKPVNRGAIDSMILFLDKCQTEYIYTVASDDVAIPEGIVDIVRQLQSNPMLGFVIGGGQNLLADGRRTALYGKKHDRLFATPARELPDAMFLTDPSPLLCQSTVFRVSALRTAEALDPSIVADDYAIFGKLFQHFNRRGIDFDFRPEIDCVLYRHHPNNSYLKLVRQATTHCQVIRHIARPPIRAQAIGYKVAFLMLVAIRKGRISALAGLLNVAGIRNIGWVFAGLFINAYQRLKYR